MAVIGTFSQFTTARLALYASQASLSVTGNNIANINTPGYTRQRMDLVSLYSTGTGKYANIFDTHVGYGVLTNGATQLRDPYLDIRFRNENTKLSAYEEKADGLYQIGNILDEVGKGTGELKGFGVIEAQFGEFLKMLDKGLNTNIGSEEYDDLVRSAASTLTSYFRKAASDLQDIKVNKANELNETISEVNKLLNQIRDLNSQIRTQNIYGDKALELRDARNLAIDELSSYIPIDVTYSMERIDQFSEVEKLTITIKNSQGPDGRPIKLVDGIYGSQLTMPEVMARSNPNADSAEIVRLMNDARTIAEAKYPRDQAFIDSVNDLAEQEGQKAADEYAAQNPDATPEELEIIKNRRMSEVRREEEEKRLNAIEQEVQDVRAAAEKTMGKYLLRDGTATDDWEAAIKDYGYFNYNEENPIDEHNLYLLRVEQLVDQRGRVMDDPYDPSYKSQAIALGDTTFCAKSADASLDITRADSNALGSLQAIREMLTRKGEYSSNLEIMRDDYATDKRGIPYYELALDNLANKFAYIFNQANQMPLETVYGFATPPAGVPVTDANGKQLTMPDGTALTWDMVVEEVPVLDYNGKQVVDDNGDPVTMYQFKQFDVDANGDPTNDAAKNKELKEMIELVRKEAQKAPGYSFYDGGVLISNRGDNNDSTGITAANISVSYSWSNHTVRILNTTQKNEVDGDGNESSHTTRRDNVSHMIGLFDTKWDYEAKTVRPNASATLPVFHGTFREVFTSIGATLAEDYYATAGKVENYTISTLSLDNDRLSVSGVDLNEEATSMMQFSKSYSAACRLLTTIDSMLDTLINGTAR